MYIIYICKKHVSKSKSPNPRKKKTYGRPPVQKQHGFVVSAIGVWHRSGFQSIFGFHLVVMHMSVDIQKLHFENPAIHLAVAKDS